jgi:hypothetical protein
MARHASDRPLNRDRSFERDDELDKAELQLEMAEMQLDCHF